MSAEYVTCMKCGKPVHKCWCASKPASRAHCDVATCSLPVGEAKEIVDAWGAYRRLVTWDEQVGSYEQWDKCDARMMAAIGKLEAAIGRQPEENTAVSDAPRSL